MAWGSWGSWGSMKLSPDFPDFPRCKLWGCWLCLPALPRRRSVPVTPVTPNTSKYIQIPHVWQSWDVLQEIGIDSQWLPHCDIFLFLCGVAALLNRVRCLGLSKFSPDSGLKVLKVYIYVCKEVGVEANRCNKILSYQWYHIIISEVYACNI
jgi:hypothetical protein